MRRERKVPWSLYLPIAVVDGLDRVAERRGMSRSAVATLALTEWLAEHGEGPAAGEREAPAGTFPASREVEDHD